MSEDAVVAEELSVEAEAETEELQSEEQAPEPSESSTEKKESKGVQKRIDELTRNWRDTERDRDYWRELALNKAKEEPQAPKAPETTEPLKTLEDFEYDEARYQSYLFQEATKRATEAARRELEADQQKTVTSNRQRQFLQREQDFAKGKDDYYSIARNPTLQLNQTMVDVIQDSDDGPALAYYLGKNPQIADQIASMAPYQAAKEMGRIEAKLAFDRESKGESVTKAPAPPPKLDGLNPAIDKDPDKMNTSEWLAWRNKQLKR